MALKLLENYAWQAGIQVTEIRKILKFQYYLFTGMFVQ
jgi:hypothetical protein